MLDASKIGGYGKIEYYNYPLPDRPEEDEIII